MSALLEHLECRSTSTQSAISFERTGGGNWKEWDRFLVLDGKPAYHIGNICDTCSFFFKRLEGAVRSLNPESRAAALTAGVSTLRNGLGSDLAQLLPEGDYHACLARCRPELAKPGGANDYFSREQIDLHGLDPFWDLPHDPRTEYYRLDTAEIEPGRRMFEFLVPMFPGSWLKPEVVDRYAAAFASGAVPTALAISILDVKGPADGGGADVEHACLTHYLLDGHHKFRAAARGGWDVGLISFLAVGHGVSNERDRAAVLAALSSKAA